jgi:HEPN domain-containing protein
MNPHNPHDWLLKADRDFGLASHASVHTPEYPDLICYHCQQAAEKFLKALVIHHGLPLRKTHDLEDLLDLLSPIEVSISIEFYENARKINDYGVQIRYPDPSGDPSEADVVEALAASKFFRDFAILVIGV